MNWRLRRKIGIGLAVIGISPFIGVEYYARFAHNWTPLNVPVMFKPGEFRSPEFKTDLNDRYLVGVAADQLMPPTLRREHCMMGVGSRWDCGEVKWTLQFEWQIISKNGEVLANGEYMPVSVGPEIGFAEFQGRRNSRQSIVLRILRDAGELNSYHPRLVVEAVEDWEAFAVLSLVSRILAGTVGVIGLLLFIFST